MSLFVANDDVATEVRGRWLHALREPWPRVVCRLLEAGESAIVRVLVADVRGSSPREPGACMLVSPDETYGTIGGGNLEWQAIRAARSFLVTGTVSVQLRRLVLGRELGQCCGGVVQLWLERFTRADLPLLSQAGSAIMTELSEQGVVRRLLQRGAAPRRLQFSAGGDGRTTLIEPVEENRGVLWVYGAGHVAQALIRIVAELPFEVTWIDSRAELLPASVPDNVHPLNLRTPTNSVNAAPAGARLLVMTHDHALDYALCRKILERNDFAWLGLIGSKSKGARFRSRFARDGLAPEVISRLVCPIGVDGVNSKLPAAIAVAVAAQLLQGLDGPAHGAPSGVAGTAGASAAAGPSAFAAASPATSAASGAFADTCGSPHCTGCSGARTSLTP